MGLGQQVRLRQAVDGAGTREDESLDVMPQRRVDQGVRLGHVVVEVALGLPDQFAHFYVAREVDHRPRPVAREHLVEARLVADVAALQRPPLHRPVVALLQRVVADRLVAGFGQRLADVAADIASAAGDEDGGHQPSFAKASEGTLLRAGTPQGSALRSAPARSRMVPGEGFEPPTFGLQNRCTTTVLTRRRGRKYHEARRRAHS